VSVIQQNASSDGTDSITITGWVLKSSLNVTGWLHDPQQEVNPPAVAASASGDQHVFWKGTDGTLYQYLVQRFSGKLAAAPELPRHLGSAPAAGIDQSGNQYVFWKGTDNSLWEDWYNAGTAHWSGGQNLGQGPLG
jgi:hypothetical protein